MESLSGCLLWEPGPSLRNLYPRTPFQGLPGSEKESLLHHSGLGTRDKER